MKRWLFILLCLYMAACATHAAGDFRFRRLSVEDGLSSNTVRDIVQDSRGFIWIGTNEGLDRYDGNAVKTFRCGTAASFITALHDDGTRLWVGTEEGVYLFSYESESFTRFTQAATDDGGEDIHSRVNQIVPDMDGNLWITTMGQGLFRYNVAAGNLYRFPFEENGGLMSSVYVDTENQIWTMSVWGTQPLLKLDKAEGRFKPVEPHYDKAGYDCRSLVMVQDGDQYLWLGTWENGLQRLDRYTGNVTTYLHPSQAGGVTHIHSLLVYGPQQLLVGSDDGLLLFHTVTGEYKSFVEDAANPYALSNRFVYPLMKDVEGGVWIGTYYGGVNYIAPHTEQFESFNTLPGAEAVNGMVVGGFCEDGAGHIWISSDDGGLSRYCPQEERFTHYVPKGLASPFYNVHALAMDGDDLWIGTYTGGVNVLDTKSGRFRNYNKTAAPGSLDSSSSYAIYKDSRGRVWVATMSGLNRYNPASDDFTRIKTLNVIVIDIDEDAAGNLWLSTQGKGLFKYNPDSGEWTQYTTENTAGALPADQVNCMYTSGDSIYWIGTMNGLCRYLPAEGRFEPVALTIPGNDICYIVEDQHVLWMTTTQGLVRYLPGDGCKVFMKDDGLQSNQFMPNAGLKASDGKIYIGSVNGINAFYPYKIKTNRHVPPVFITGLEVFNKEVAVGGGLLKASLVGASRLDLSYRENVFSLSFAALSYCVPGKNQFSYRLEGFDKAWNNVGSHHKATYTNLPAGKYLFQVKGTNNDGVWNEEGCSLLIVIHPPFYFTLGFKIAYVVLALAIILWVVWYVLQRVKKRQAEEIERLNAAKEHEVHEAKINFFTRIAHEIRTPVSLIIGPLEKIMTSGTQLPAAVREDLRIINSNSRRLLFLINQLLDFRKVEQEKVDLRFVWIDLPSLLQGVCGRFRPTIEQSGAQLTVSCPQERIRVMADEEALTKVVSNLLTNAGKYTKDRVDVSCKVHEDRQVYEIAVADNGMGIAREEQDKIFKPFYRGTGEMPGTGLGLSIVKSIVAMHGGGIHVISEPGKGSTFTVTLPIEQDAAPQQTVPADAALQEAPIDILQESTASKASKERSTMLIVEDNHDMSYFLSSIFSDRYTILVAEDGQAALELLQANDVAFIVSDWMMPRMDGVQLCRAVRADWKTSHIPFILLTARTDTPSKIAGMDCGADIYIEKPFSVQYLEACIHNLTELRGMLRAKFSKMPLVPLTTIARNATDDSFLARLNHVIEENFSNPELTVDFLAAELCISRSSLFAKIKAVADVTPNELIQVARLKRAAVLLRQNKYRINEICYMVGFNTPSYFTKCFQKQFGVKPGDFAASQG
ncbi:MAG: ATP-binding protein [Prevotellaceae bacterium]|nr:ATP-binding protein [Prevotellaceae bacterium]